MIIEFEMLQIDFLDTLRLILIHGKFWSKIDLSAATSHTFCFWAPPPPPPSEIRCHQINFSYTKIEIGEALKFTKMLL